jgi:hypothetical protein
MMRLSISFSMSVTTVVPCKSFSRLMCDSWRGGGRMTAGYRNNMVFVSVFVSTLLLCLNASTNFWYKEPQFSLCCIIFIPLFTLPSILLCFLLFSSFLFEKVYLFKLHSLNRSENSKVKKMSNRNSSSTCVKKKQNWK